MAQARTESVPCAEGVLCQPAEGTRIDRHPKGERWCFICRGRRPFELVLVVEPFPSYYAPSPSIRCADCGSVDGDLFPGRIREW